MDKRKILLISLFSLVSLGVFLVILRYSIRVKQELLFVSVPSYLVSNTNCQYVNLKKELTNFPSVLIYFNSSCPICQSEAELIHRNFSENLET
ncbi:hypothetical protein Aconfl_43680 [Algoriphagus confluentis]|uniref:AhpC/TSA family protein n=1 Tax=Algoriphagus confluentis TaxID=1697556 RepID=A0ABQ6PVW5_9BACT|nr:hypothetical protein Aconfl_43680 [Algoriphagus confluentis]